MLYLYDRAICKDLSESFNPDNMENSLVTVAGPELATQIYASQNKDKIKFPAVVLLRSKDTPVDTSRTNFTMIKQGVACVFDKENNLYYHERALPIKMSYTLTVLSTNVEDRDEIVRELIFKYASMYFLTIKLPYESKRKVRFGIQVDLDGIQNESGTSEYFENGHIYQSILTLNCEGCVLVTYTPVKLKRLETQIITE